jgi:hypothetical protein
MVRAIRTRRKRIRQGDSESPLSTAYTAPLAPTAASPTPMKNVPVPGPPPVESKLLHEMPSPSSDWTARQPHVRWVARMTKRSASIGVGKSASRDGGRTERPDHYPRPSPQRRLQRRPGRSGRSGCRAPSSPPSCRATSPRRDNSTRAIARSRIWAALIRRGSRQTTAPSLSPAPTTNTTSGLTATHAASTGNTRQHQCDSVAARGRCRDGERFCRGGYDR